MSWRRAGTLLALTLSGCASIAGATRVSIDDVRAVTGVWHGWLITPRDSLTATLEIRDDATFTLSAPRVRVSGALSPREGLLYFEGPGAWHGTITLYEVPGRRVLKAVRDDRLFPGRFTAISKAARD